jgi:hypothetical protein
MHFKKNLLGELEKWKTSGSCLLDDAVWKIVTDILGELLLPWNHVSQTFVDREALQFIKYLHSCVATDCKISQRMLAAMSAIPCIHLKIRMINKHIIKCDMSPYEMKLGSSCMTRWRGECLHLRGSIRGREIIIKKHDCAWWKLVQIVFIL